MFEDLEEERVDVTPESPDRAIAWSIWSRSEEGSLTPDEAWGIFHERYPDDPRFLLLNAYSELGENKRQSERVLKAAVVVGANAAKPEAGLWTPTYFLKKIERVAAGASDALHPQIRDLMTFGGTIVAAAKGEDAALVAALRAKLGTEGEAEPKRDDRDRAGLRLRRFEREVLRELDERTEGNKPLGVRAAAPASGAAAGNDWASAVADKEKPRRRYAADATFARGELVEHPKFGVGVVTGTEPGKAVILFESGTRKLVAGAT